MALDQLSEGLSEINGTDTLVHNKELTTRVLLDEVAFMTQGDSVANSLINAPKY